MDVVDRAASLKGSTTLSLCIPCFNESRTIGNLVERLLGDPRCAFLVDELLVIDDHSTDASAAVARSCGAQVVAVSDVLHTAGPGKGGAIVTSIVSSTSDVLVWLDADIQGTELDWVAQLALPLFSGPEVMLVKGDYRRPGVEGGGRTTELVARPLISLFFPQLAFVNQPLAGEMAVRREAVMDIHIPGGWGIEMAVLLDVAAAYGPEAITQVDLGEKVHRHQPLSALTVQAAEILCTVIDRLGEADVQRVRDTMPRFVTTAGGTQMLKSSPYPTARSLSAPRP